MTPYYYPIWLPSAIPIPTGHPTVTSYHYSSSEVEATAIHIENGVAYLGWARFIWVQFKADGPGWVWVWDYLENKEGYRRQALPDWQNHIF